MAIYSMVGGFRSLKIEPMSRFQVNGTDLVTMKEYNVTENLGFISLNYIFIIEFITGVILPYLSRS